MEDKPPDQGTIYWITLAVVLLTGVLIAVAAVLFGFKLGPFS